MDNKTFKAIGYEADIFFKKNSQNKIYVVKKYKDDCEAINWLNIYLDDFYDKTIAMPVAQHEVAAMNFLRKFNIAPTSEIINNTSIKITFSGHPLEVEKNIGVISYFRQTINILKVFKKIGFYHNDLLPRNILVLNKKIRIIDFTMSEFNNIKTMDYLPNNKWARARKDYMILTYFPWKNLLTNKGINDNVSYF